MTKTIGNAAAALCLGLCLGLAGGAWAMRIYFDQTLMHWSPAERLVMKLSEDLNLDSEQRLQTALILADQKEKVEVLRKAWSRQVELLDREGEQNIAGLLTDAQTRQFIKLHDSIHGQVDRFLWVTDAGPTLLAIGPTRN